MKFTLIYDGELPSAGNGSRKTKEKWDIRKAFHPQLEELWQTHRTLKPLSQSGLWLPKNSDFGIRQVHHSSAMRAEHWALPNPDSQWNLIEAKKVGSGSFLPLVRETLALTCSLNITFLRKEDPGSLILQGGDLDNRIETLFDGMRMPSDETEMAACGPLPEPFYCVMESDSLITGFTVQTGRLLSGQSTSDAEVRLVIEVTVSTTEAMLYNLSFLGD